MQDTEIEKLVDFALSKARQQILDGDEVLRTFFCQDRDGGRHLVVAPSAGFEADTNMISYLKLMFAILGVEAYCMMSEVWYVEGSDKASLQKMRPSENPNRKEALMAMIVRRSKDDRGRHGIDARSVRAVITREPTAVGPIEWDTPERIEGRFAELLPPIDTPPCPDVDAAMVVLQAYGAALGIGGMNIPNPTARPEGVSVH